MNLLGNRYRIVSLLGAGGMGEVFLADDVRLERRVAVKLLPADLEGDQIARERLRREALAAAALDHPFICKVHEIGEADGRMFVVMEYVDGETLHAASRRALMPLRQVIDIAHQLAQALDTAHRRNVVHRDLKPANVMVTAQGHVKVMDFGLAKQLQPDAAPSGAGARHGSDAGTMLTASGTRLGTPAYMSPEQVLGGALDFRTDIFSLGVILHELATGVHPFLRDEASDTMAAILRDPPVAGPRDANSVGGLGGVIGRMLSKACAERHQTMAEVLVDLEALRERAWSSSSHGSAVAPAAPAERTPFVGRDAEGAELERALDRMLTGHGALILIGGEPGVGKTRLVRELLVKGKQRGCVALTGHCYEMEGAPPFVPFVEIVEQTVRVVPQGARAAMGDLAAEIAAMVPSLRRTFADIPPLPEVPADQQRRLIFSAFLEYVQRGSQKSPGVLLFDDLHWADEPTLQLLLHTAPHLASMRLLVVGTYRDVELDVKRPFAKALESLLRQRLATRITLRRLNESGVQQMLTAMGGSPPPSELAHAVFRETEGNPFFVEEVFQHLAEEGKLFESTGSWKADLRFDTLDVPEGVRLVIGRRLDRLGDDARKVLTAAAVIGRTFPLDVLQASVDFSEDAVLDAVEEAERAQLVGAAADRRSARYGFVHELIRTTLIAGLSLPRRQRLHLRIADAVERLRAASLDSHASVLAHHLYQAGAAADAQRTAAALAQAGTRALTAGAFEEALESFDNLISLELAEPDPLLADAWERRGQALTALRRHDESIAAFERALAIYIALGNDAGIERAARGASSVRAWRGAMGREGLGVLQRALQAISSHADRERALLLAWTAAAQISSADPDILLQTIAKATAIAERLDNQSILGQVLTAKASIQRAYCDYRGAAVTVRKALSVTARAAQWDRANLLAELATDEFYMGRFATCEELHPELEAAGTAAGHHGALFVELWEKALIPLLRTGDLRHYLNASAEVLAQPHFQYLTRTAVAVARLYTGEIDGVLQEFAAIVDDLPANNWFQGMPEGNLFGAAVLIGEPDRARQLIPMVVRRLPRSGQVNVQGAYNALFALATGLAIIGERERCAALYPLALDFTRSGMVQSVVVVGPVNPELAAAVAADAAGLTDRARDHFETALRQAHEVPIRFLQPAVRYWYGRALSRASDLSEHPRGRAMIESAVADYRLLGMPLHVALAEASLRSLP